MWLHYYRCISKILIDTSDCMLKSVFDDHAYTTALLVITIVILLNWFLKLPSKVPPGPMILPLIGCLDRFDENNIQKVYLKWRKKYGDVFSFRLGSKLYVVVNGYENIKEYVLNHNQVFSNRATNYLFTTLLKNAGVISSNDEMRKRIRRLVVTNLKRFGVGTPLQESLIQREVHEMLSFFDRQQGKAFNPRRIIATTIANVTGQISFGRRYDFNDTELTNVILDANEIIGSFSFTCLANYFPFVKYIPYDPTGIRKICDRYHRILNLMKVILCDHRKTWIANNPRDITDCLLDEQIKENPLPEENVITIMWDMFVAGSEGPSTNTYWAFLILMLYPDIQSRMHEEMCQRIGKHRLPTYDDRHQLPYCQAVLAEILRFNGFNRFFSRTPTENTVVGKYTIPKNALVLFSVDTVHFDDDYFKEPNKFNPDRFLTKDGEFTSNNRNITFGLGIRKCPGYELANSEMYLLITSIVHRFKLIPEDEDNRPSLDNTQGIFAHPKPYRLKAVPFSDVIIKE